MFHHPNSDSFIKVLCALAGGRRLLYHLSHPPRTTSWSTYYYILGLGFSSIPLQPCYLTTVGWILPPWTLVPPIHQKTWMKSPFLYFLMFSIKCDNYKFFSWLAEFNFKFKRRLSEGIICSFLWELLTLRDWYVL